MKITQEMSNIQDKLNAPNDPQSPSSTKLTMTVKTELQPPDKDSESTCPKPAEATSSDTREVSKDDASVSKISDDDRSTGAVDKAKRFLPAYKKANAALTFPEKVS